VRVYLGTCPELEWVGAAPAEACLQDTPCGRGPPLEEMLCHPGSGAVTLCSVGTNMVIKLYCPKV
jgi:hypothetical protein